MRRLRWGLGGAQPCCAAAHQGRGAVADAAVTCVAVLAVAILCFQVGAFPSLVNCSRPEGRVVFFLVRNVLAEPSKVRVQVTSQSPEFGALHPTSFLLLGKAPSPSPLCPAARVAPAASAGGAQMLHEGKADVLLMSRGTRSSLLLCAAVGSWLAPGQGDTLGSFR